MGVADKETKAYMRKNEIFADAFNFFLYDGERKIQPERLRELDTTELAQLPGTNEKQLSEVIQKYRDVLKAAVIMQDEKASYLLLGIENQMEVHYAMPVRNMLYDAVQYAKQVSELAADHRGHRAELKMTGAEYLSGFLKSDKILPVITLVIHFSETEWDGAKSLHEMMEWPDIRLKEYVQDYKIQLIDPAKIKPEEFEKFSTSLREVLEYIKYSKDKKKLRKLVENNPRMTMEVNAARVIQAVTGTKFRISEETEVVDMCQAIDEMMADSREDGMKEGIEKGIEKGIQKGMTLGLTKGLEKGRIEALSNLLKKGTISIQDAADCMAMSVTEFKKLVNTYSI